MTLVPPKTFGSGAEGARDGEVPSGSGAASAAPEGAEEGREDAAVGAERLEADSGIDAGTDPALVGPAPTEPRRHPSTIGGAFYLVILAATVVGIVIVSTGRWRTGVHWMGGALVVGALLRSVLPTRDAGMLAVRHRWFDAALLGGTGVALWILASSIPDA